MAITVLGEGTDPKEAIEYWKSRIPISNKDLETLSKEVKERVFYVAGLAKLDQVNLIHNKLLEALENGTTLETFKTEIAEVIKKQGWDKHRIETIFQTNMQTAYQAGRWKSMQRTKKYLPYLQYSSVLDNRTRPQHSVLHGIVFPADNPFWDSHYPPNGFNCRCTVIPLSEYQVKKEGLEVKEELPKSFEYTDKRTGITQRIVKPQPDPGFAHNVGKDWIKSIENPLFDKLEKTDPNIAKPFIKKLIEDNFEDWQQNPNIEFPVGVLSKEQSERFRTKKSIIRLSQDTIVKQNKHHPELTLKDYLKIQDAINKSEMYQQNENSYAFILEEKDGIVCIVKVTKEKDKLYLTSMRRLSNDEIKKSETIRQIKRGQRKK